MDSSHDTGRDSFFCSIGSETSSLSDEDLRRTVHSFMDFVGTREDVLIIPPDFTRYNSQAGKLTQFICEYYEFIPSCEPHLDKQRLGSDAPIPNIEILPALGTHAPMTPHELTKMYGPHIADMEPSPIIVHDWRNDVVTIGHCPAEMVRAATGGMVDQPWPVQLNTRVWEKRLHDPHKQAHKSLVLSIGQVVPHEVMGMANFNKNLFVGTGGVEAINLSHFIGAVHGMERMMGKKDNPMRDILNHASEMYLENELDLWYVLTVVSPDPEHIGKLCVRGLFIGRDIQCYSAACDLSLIVNFTLLDQPVHRMVVYLDEEEFHSTWLGNKAIYRTRMAMADDGELIILAPGVSRFGEDGVVDQLIRKYGYRGTPTTMKAMEDHQELRDNLSAVAHLIHGSSEGRFKITYCPGLLSRREIEQVGFCYSEYDETKARYDIEHLRDGWNIDNAGEFYFIRNPAIGLWAEKSRLADDEAERSDE